MKTSLTTCLSLLLTMGLALLMNHVHAQALYDQNFFSAVEVEPLWEQVATNAMAKIHLNEDDQMVVVSSDGDVYVTHSNGKWTKDNTQNSSDLEQDHGTLRWEQNDFDIVQSIDINDSTILALTESASFVSTDQGKSWEQAGGPFNPITQMTTTASSAIYGVSPLDNTVYRYNHSSLDWEEVIQLTYAPVVIEPIFNNGLIVGAEGEIYITLNGGRAWMSMGYGADYATASDILVRGNSIFAATDYGLYECKLPNATISEIEGEGMDMPLIAGVAAESVKMVKTSDESGLEIRSVQNSIPVGKGFIDYTIEIPMDGSYAITLMSAAGTEIPIVGAMDLTTGKYNLQVYNSSYQGVCYLKVEGNSDYHIVASLVR